MLKGGLRLISLLWLLGCQTDPLPVTSSALPAKTTSGYHTFGCLVQDSLWLPQPFAKAPALMTNWTEDGKLYVYAENKSKKAIITLRVYDVFSEGAYDLETISCTQNICTEYSDDVGNYQVIDGQLLITRLDPISSYHLR